MPLYINSTDINAISESIGEVTASVVSAYNEALTFNSGDADLSPDRLAESLDQFVDILLLIEVDKANAMMFQDAPRHLNDSIYIEDVKPLDESEISEIGNHGLGLLQSLADWALTLHLPVVQHKIQFVMVAVSLWVARHGGTLYKLDSVGSTITALANATMDPEVLTELSHAMGELINAVSEDIRYNISTVEQKRSWRALNISRGIIATRSHNVVEMEQVFEELVSNIPEEASVFFEEGLQQLDMLDYPMHVKNIMVKYFRQHTTQVLH